MGVNFLASAVLLHGLTKKKHLLSVRMSKSENVVTLPCINLDPRVLYRVQCSASRWARFHNPFSLVSL